MSEKDYCKAETGGTTNNYCKARITLNGDEFECHCQTGHVNSHQAGVMMNDGGIEFFGWDIDDLGQVVFDIPAKVAWSIFRQASSWTGTDGYTAA
jgi:hypothetical protein